METSGHEELETSSMSIVIHQGRNKEDYVAKQAVGLCQPALHLKIKLRAKSLFALCNGDHGMNGRLCVFGVV